MQLSDNDLRDAQALRASHMLWNRRRWYCLGAGVLTTAAGIFLISNLARRAVAVGRWDGELVYVAPAFWALFFLGIYLSTTTLIRWRGDRVIVLLLRILEVVQSDVGSRPIVSRDKSQDG